MRHIDIYEMIEVQLAQPPYNLPEGDGRRQELVYDLVAHIPPHIFAAALRNIAEDTGLRMDTGEHDDEGKLKNRPSATVQAMAAHWEWSDETW